jgi:hypothetical protein
MTVLGGFNPTSGGGRSRARRAKGGGVQLRMDLEPPHGLNTTGNTTLYDANVQALERYATKLVEIVETGELAAVSGMPLRGVALTRDFGVGVTGAKEQVIGDGVVFSTEVLAERPAATRAAKSNATGVALGVIFVLLVLGAVGYVGYRRSDEIRDFVSSQQAGRAAKKAQLSAVQKRAGRGGGALLNTRSNSMFEEPDEANGGSFVPQISGPRALRPQKAAPAAPAAATYLDVTPEAAFAPIVPNRPADATAAATPYLDVTPDTAPGAGPTVYLDVTPEVTATVTATRSAPTPPPQKAAPSPGAASALPSGRPCRAAPTVGELLHESEI